MSEEEFKVRTCPNCKQEWKVKTGLTSENFKRMMRMPTLDEWITLFIILMVILSAYAYKADTKVCRDAIANMNETCTVYFNSLNRDQINDPLTNASSILNLGLAEGSGTDNKQE